jgi:UDP-glucuronate decarboxylase
MKQESLMSISKKSSMRSYNANKCILATGGGSQTRSFCYVDDLIEALIRAMNSPEELAGPVTIGNPAEFSMLDLAESLLVQTGSKSRVVFMPLPGNDPKQRRPDIALARRALNGWDTKVDWATGLRRTIAYYQQVSLP